MKLLLAALLVSSMAAMASTQITCETDNYEKLKPFGRDQAERMSFPCAYYALREQECGAYTITLIPNNIWLKDNYRLMSLTLSVKKGSESWEGTTTNKQVIKFLNGGGDGKKLFNTTGGTVERKDLMEHGQDGYDAYIKDKDGDFILTIRGFHPKASGETNPFRHSGFSFTCNVPITKFNPYPEQMCGNGSNKVVETIAEHPPYNLKGAGSGVANRILIDMDAFSTTDLDQPDEKCAEAVSTFSQCGDFERKLLVMKNCEEILAGGSHTTCVTRYSCHPMDVFNACLRWGCEGDKAFHKSVQEPCEATGVGIDMCPEFVSIFGSLTQRMRDANCYRDFLSVA